MESSKLIVKSEVPSVSIAMWFFVAHKAKTQCTVQYKTLQAIRFRNAALYCRIENVSERVVLLRLHTSNEMRYVILAASVNEYGSVYYILNFIRVLYTTKYCFLCVFEVRLSVCCVYLSWSKRVLFHLVFIVYRDFHSICSVNCIRFDFFASRASVWDIPLWMDPTEEEKKHAQFIRKIEGFSFCSASSEVVVQRLRYIVRACKYVLKIRESVHPKRFVKIGLIQFGNKNYKLNSSVLVRVKKWIVNV